MFENEFFINFAVIKKGQIVGSVLNAAVPASRLASNRSDALFPPQSLLRLESHFDSYDS